MSNLSKHALVARLLDKMREADSWAGRTHLQKTLYLFQLLFQRPDDRSYRYILYKHGPYSFELDEDLAEMEFYGAIAREEQRNYGPRYSTKRGAADTLVAKWSPDTDRWLPKLDFVAKRVSVLGVRQLEAVATIAHIETEPEENQQFPTRERRTARVKHLKPHLTDRELESAYNLWTELRAAAEQQSVAAG